MPISGLVLTLKDDRAESLRRVLQALEVRPEVTVGQSVECKFPIATETHSVDHDRELREWIASLPDVVHVDVTFIAFESEMESAK